MLRGSRAFSGRIHRPFLVHVVPPLVARISWRRLVAKVGTFENKKVHKHLHLWPLGPHRRRLAVRAGTSKGSKISQYGISHRSPIERRTSPIITEDSIIKGREREATSCLRQKTQPCFETTTALTMVSMRSERHTPLDGGQETLLCRVNLSRFGLVSELHTVN